MRNVATGRFANGAALRDALEVSAALLGERLAISASGPMPSTPRERSVDAGGARLRAKRLGAGDGHARANSSLPLSTARSVATSRTSSSLAASASPDVTSS